MARHGRPRRGTADHGRARRGRARHGTARHGTPGDDTKMPLPAEALGGNSRAVGPRLRKGTRARALTNGLPPLGRPTPPGHELLPGADVLGVPSWFEQFHPLKTRASARGRSKNSQSSQQRNWPRTGATEHSSARARTSTAEEGRSRFCKFEPVRCCRGVRIVFIC